MPVHRNWLKCVRTCLAVQGRKQLTSDRGFHVPRTIPPWWPPHQAHPLESFVTVVAAANERDQLANQP